jgi:ATP-dependent DNA helicase RecQ
VLSAAPSISDIDPRIAAALRQYWGFETLRPMQAEAIAAGIARRDSLVVMPTGGGKSLCYQVPPIVENRIDIVVSPLIALMKDQVDGLRENGYPAIALHSGQGNAVNRELLREIREGRYRLVFVAPERLLHPAFLSLCDNLEIGAFAIDEAHCISQWGHDFRPEYRRLAELRARYPHVSVHAYTATATPRVREDILAQLRLRDPAVLVGDFDRANLTYRVRPKVNLEDQVAATLHRHRGDASIVYCISRRETERLAEKLRGRGFRAAHYHAGMEPEDRQRTQDRFQSEKIDVVVATVAFGMGIDRGDVRCVIHASLPKTVEHYQQETGRAGRDGLPAECVLFYSAADAERWRDLIAQSAENAESPQEVIRAMEELLRHMRTYCEMPRCRHAFLVEYFGQTLGHHDCKACDVCLGEVTPATDETELCRKILSGVARTGQRFGASHVIAMLLGKNTAAIRSRGHDQLSTFGLLKKHDPDVLKNCIDQLVGQGLLERPPGELPSLRLTHAGIRAMRGETKVFLRIPPTAVEERRASAAIAAQSGKRRPPFDPAPGRGPRYVPAAAIDAEDYDPGLFEALRELRRDLAEERGVPAFVIFQDTVLRELARRRPSTAENFRAVRGVGARKQAELGPRFAEAIRRYCEAHALPMDLFAEVS